jgi:hypothetical protein
LDKKWVAVRPAWPVRIAARCILFALAVLVSNTNNLQANKWQTYAIAASSSEMYKMRQCLQYLKKMASLRMMHSCLPLPSPLPLPGTQAWRA